MRTAAAWIVGALLVILVAWGALHVFISPVNPRQEPSETHVQSACWACHFVSDAAKITTVSP